MKNTLIWLGVIAAVYGLLVAPWWVDAVAFGAFGAAVLKVRRDARVIR